MCGIVSIFSKKSNVSLSLLQKAVTQLHHRGPDGQGLWISENRKIGLGHRRLSIIDLETGEQPISNLDNSLHIVANGEFYDFENIRDSLETSGCKFTTKSDSEIALQLYDKYGTQSLQKLRGEFAFIIWDERNKVLFAARDRFGIKPLFYSMQGDDLFIASEIKALFSAGIPAEWDYEGVFQFTNLLYTSQERTLYKNIFQVPPGHYILATENSFKIVCYWDFNYPSEDIERDRLSDAEYIEQFSSILNDAVRLRLRADVPVGCYLSGGVDAASILAIANLHSSNPIKLFTLAFDQEEYDELSIAQEMARHINSEVLPITVSQADLADNFEKAVWHTETPFVNTNVVAKYILSGFVRESGIKSVITGEGADEVLGGYLPFRKDMLLYSSGKTNKAAINLLNERNKINSGIFVSHGNTKPLTRVNNILGYIPSFFESFSSNAVKFQEIYSDTFRESYEKTDAYSLFLDGLCISNQVTNRHVLNQSLYLWSKGPLPNYILCVLADRVEMANSVEGRVPFLDHHLVEFLSRIPPDLKIRGTTEKYILREAIKPLIPEKIYKRQKFAFKAPPATILGNENSYELLQDTLRSSELTALPFFNAKKVINLLDSLPGMDEESKLATDTIVTTIMCFCILQKKFGLQTA